MAFPLAFIARYLAVVFPQSPTGCQLQRSYMTYTPISLSSGPVTSRDWMSMPSTQVHRDRPDTFTYGHGSITIPNSKSWCRTCVTATICFLADSRSDLDRFSLGKFRQVSTLREAIRRRFSRDASDLA